MCLYPRLIQNKKYTNTKKNGGNVPPILDTRVLAVPIGCNKCMECKKQKARSWSVRLQEEIRTNKTGKMVTLTLSNEEYTKISKQVKTTKGYEHDNEIATYAVRHFLERWRKKYKKSVRHWLITELGTTRYEKVHIHGIIFTNEVEDIQKIWGYGYVYIGEYVNEKTINYIVKYVNKTDQKHKYYNSKILTSNGIGKNYTNRIDSKRNKYNKENTKEEYITRNGTKLNMPIYYRNKLYTEEEKEKLWIQKIENNTRYVDGEKIDISKGNQEYNKILKEAQIKNQRLGYGGEKEKWKEKEYEEQRRIMLQKQTKGEEPLEIKQEKIILGTLKNAW